jgi:hypothetical protein
MKKDYKNAAPQQMHGKDTHFLNQYQIVYKAFKCHPKTMLQVSIETGILRANICRYVADMKDNGLIQIIYKSLCPITHFRAGFYSTDSTLFKKEDKQLPLFDMDEL